MIGKAVKFTVLSVVMIAVVGAFGASARGAWLGPCSVVSDSAGQKLYIAQAKANCVAVYDVASGKVKGCIDVPDSPTSIALSPDRKTLYVTCGSTRGSAVAVDVASKKIVKRFRAGYGAQSAVLSPDGGTLYVCNRFNNDVSAVDTKTGEQTQRARVLREPVAAAITPDGKWLYVGNLLPDGPATANVVASSVSVINAETMKVDSSIVLPNGSTGLHGVAASADGKYVFVAHILGRYTVPTTQLERGWINTNALTIIDAKTRKLIETVLLDDVDRGAANPWAVAVTPDSKHVCVTHAGSHELSVVDVEAMMKKIEERHAQLKDKGKTGGYSGSYRSSSGSEIPNELSFLYGIRRRVKLLGKGARSLAIVGAKAYVPEYFTDSISIVDIAKESRARPQAAKLGSDGPMTVLREGEMLFNDASLCFQSWQSCASCHPSDARVDALNWDLLNDGLGNPKNTKSLLLAHQTPPSMMTGVRATAEAAVRAGIKHIQFAVRPEKEAVAIDEYLKSLKPVPSPFAQRPKLSDSIKRGKDVFEKARCASCHSGQYHTDLKRHDVGTGEVRDEGVKFDTPSLVELWRTGPYLYDGRAATVEDVLTRFNPDDKHGETSGLTDKEIRDLVQFLLSL